MKEIKSCYCGKPGMIYHLTHGTLVRFCCSSHKEIWKVCGDRGAIEQGQLKLEEGADLQQRIAEAEKDYRTERCFDLGTDDLFYFSQ